jgi:hypothetical protein
MSYIPYDRWFNKYNDALNKLDSISANKNSEKINKKFSECLYNLEDADIQYDLGVIAPIILSCRRTYINNMEAYQITSSLNDVEDLTLYLEPNLTQCPRYLALIYKITN